MSVGNLSEAPSSDAAYLYFRCCPTSDAGLTYVSYHNLLPWPGNTELVGLAEVGFRDTTSLIIMYYGQHLANTHKMQEPKEVKAAHQQPSRWTGCTS